MNLQTENSDGKNKEVTLRQNAIFRLTQNSLFGMITEPDIKETFLKQAQLSNENQLPDFARCAEDGIVSKGRPE